jgi:hypothetical protein
LVYGFEGLLRKGSSKPSHLKVSEGLRERIIELRKALYYDFNILHFKDKLSECHGINLSHEALRQILIKHNLHTPKAKRKIYRRRRRMPCAGLLVQMDSSEHRWEDSIIMLRWNTKIPRDTEGIKRAGN